MNYYQRGFERRIRVGMVGIGDHTYRNLLPALHYLPVELVALSAHRNEARAKLTAKEYGCHWYMSPADMYGAEDLEAVFICVSPELHPELVCQAFDAGLHVWLEKPPAMRVAGVEQMIQHRGDRICVVGFKKAFMPVVDKALEIVGSNDYGDLRSILGVYPMSVPKNGEAVLEEGLHITWLENGVHPLSFLIAIGGAVETITVHTGSTGHGVAVLAFKSGVVGTFHLASGPLSMESYSLFGETWYCTINNNTKLSLYRDYGPKGTHTFMPAGFDTGAIVWEAQNSFATIENKNLFTQGMYAEMRYFCDCILEDRAAARGSLEFALEVMKVYEAGLRSNGQAVPIDE
ncbi:Gfo/Idh/MocA family oxidoreductase [Chloroflexi bacterium TSY]|nr:Gfo/Idh/MocA family oxidoreductase [Chloroflexi bacterium TSY]